MHSLKEIIGEIADKTDLSKEEVKKLIEEKQTELSDLVSPEGAAYIVGKELGVNLLKETKRQLKIRNIVSGMRSVDVVGRIVGISDKRDFEKNGKSGSVKNVLIGDETGTVRLSLWNDEIGLFENLQLKEGDVVGIKGCYVKEDNRGNNEMRLGKTSRIEKIREGEVDVPKAENIAGGFENVRGRKICDLREGENSEVKASLVQVFRRKPFFEVCSECGSRVEKTGDGWTCKEHGQVEPKYQIVLSGVIDDGSGNIRAVFFRDVAEKIIGKKAEELKSGSSDDPLSVYGKMDILGGEFVLSGRLKRNQFTERMEFVVNDAGNLDVKNEIQEMLKKIEKVKMLKNKI